MWSVIWWPSSTTATHRTTDLCGIAGIASLNGSPVRNARARVSTMMDMMRHRGPDQEGSWFSDDGLVALGNSRLAIVDVSNKLELPFVSSHGEARLAFNGEIYDHGDQRRSLAQSGTRFRTSSDTEVLLEGLVRHGLSYLERLDGVWAFALYQEQERRLQLCRDLLGEKPLYYAAGTEELIFASEVAPILAVMRVAPDWDFSAVACAFQFRAAPPGKTLFKDIKRLRPGYALTISPGRKQIEFVRTQQFQLEKWREFYAAEPSLNDVMEVFEEQLTLSCQRRLPSEVDFMTTLSGGIDSTLVNALLASRTDQPISSLYGHSTLVPPKQGDDLDEHEASLFTSRKLGTDHHEMIMHDRDAVGLYEENAADAFDGIFCEASTNFRQLAKYSQSLGKKVLVTSDGPDELLGGYDVDVRALQLAERGRTCRPESKARLIQRANDPDHMRNRSGSLLNWAHLVSEPFSVLPNHGGTRGSVMNTLFNANIVKSTARAFGWVDGDVVDSNESSIELSQRVALGYACTSLPDYVNTRSDKGTMRESIELRLPFQATYVAELFAATPAKWKFYKRNTSKFILRALVARHVGDSIAYRKKYGFAQPIWRVREREDWLKMCEVVGDSAIFRDFPFEKGAREFLLRPEEGRHRWMAYCLARSSERFKRELSARPASLAESV